MKPQPNSLFKGRMRIKIACILLSLGAALLLCGCPSSGSSSSDAAGAVTSKAVIGSLAGQAWKLDKWTSPDGSVQDPGPIDITFAEENRVAGFAGVNRYMGSFTFTEAGEIDPAPRLASTMMAGPAEAMSREHLYLQDFAKMSHAKLDKERLIFTGSGSLRIEFVQKK